MGGVMSDYAAGAAKFMNAEELEDYLHACNEAGLDCTTAVLEADGYVWMTYGEEHTHGGEAMAVWVTRGEPNNPDMGTSSCMECAAPFDEHGSLIRGAALSELRYPVTLLHDLLETHYGQRCGSCGHRLDHHTGQFSNGEGVCQPKSLSEAMSGDECQCAGYRRAS
jgi:hypothetical protein